MIYTYGQVHKFIGYAAWIGYNGLGTGVQKWLPSNPTTTPITFNVSYVFYERIIDAVTSKYGIGSHTATIQLKDFSDAMSYDSNYASGFVIATEPGVVNYPVSTGPVSVAALTQGYTATLNGVTWDYNNAKIIVNFSVQHL